MSSGAMLSPGVGPANVYLLGSEDALHAITGVTTGTSKPVLILGGPQNLTFALTSVGTTSGGTILIEESDEPMDAAGNYTWSQVQSIAASSFTGAAKVLVHVAIGAGIYVRVRISSAITGGGTIYVRLAGV